MKASTSDIQRLYELANDIPFDDRICHNACLSDLNLGLIRQFLRDIKSDLLNTLDSTSFENLCRQMQIAQGPDEYLKPLNIAVLMFCNEPERFFPYSRIELVEFHDEIGDSFSEKIFSGPIHVQLRDVLHYLKTNYVHEEVRKRSDRAEADRFYSYPYIALEEALANAVYHKDYSQREPIEIRIHVDRIEILSFPGPMPPLRAEDLNEGPIVVRTYRNRRIGDFLKELHLTEGRCTGVPKIRKSLSDNGSSEASFATDEKCSYFFTTIPIHSAIAKPKQTHMLNSKTHMLPADLKAGDIPQSVALQLENLSKQSDHQILREIIIELCTWRPLTAQQITTFLRRRDRRHLVRTHLSPMVEEGVLAYTKGSSAKSPGQTYRAARP